MQTNRAAKEAIPITLSQGEISEFVKRFTALDDGKKGFVTVNDLRNSLKVTTNYQDKVCLLQLFKITQIKMRKIKHFILSRR